MTTYVVSRGLAAGAAAVGVAAGAGAATAAKSWLPTAEHEAQLEAKGLRAISDVEAVATIAPLAMVSAAAIGAGIAKRSGYVAALAAASVGAASMLTSTSGTTHASADSDAAKKYVQTLGTFALTAGAGYAVGVAPRVPAPAAYALGIVAAGVAVGALAPLTADYLGSLPDALVRSVAAARSVAE